MVSAKNVFSIENEVFASFAFYSVAVLLKMYIVQFSVSFHRIARNSFTTLEDARFADPSGKLKVKTNDEVVERHRKAHLNDMENILPFVLVGLFYVATNPVASTAILLFRIFAGARFIHSIVYLFQVPQPARALSFFVGFGVMCYMAVITLMHYK